VKYPTAASVIVLVLLASFVVGQEKAPLTFSLTLMGEIEDKTATEAGFHTAHSRTTHLGFKDFDASDGEKVSITNGTFMGTGEATQYFDWKLESWAAQIVTQGDKADRDGKTVGRRAEYLLKSKGKAKVWVVMWTDEESFHLINAPTLEGALALEKLCR
jgi:hypothetical protein